MYGQAAQHESHNFKKAGPYAVMTTFSDLSPVTPSWQYVYIIFVHFRQAKDSFLNMRASPKNGRPDNLFYFFLPLRRILISRLRA